MKLQENINKMKQTNLNRYGVTCTLQRKEIVELVKQIQKEKYGEKGVFGNENIQGKIRTTMLEKYGHECCLKNEDILNKIKETNLKRYGHECPLANKTIREKIRQTNLERYGVGCQFEREDIKEQIAITRYERDLVKTSKMQDWLHSFLGGEKNYPISSYNADIAFLKDNLILEYDGPGHFAHFLQNDLMEDFEHHEKIREEKIKSNGWNIIRFISINNVLPCQSDVEKIFIFCKNLSSKMIRVYFNDDLIVIDDLGEIKISDILNEE